MADQREEIKRKIDIVELINEHVSLKKTGRNFKGLCPFHSEKTPSFIVSPERQIWHCFGSCGEGSDIFGFLMKIDNLDFGEALQVLAKRAGVKLTSYRPSESEKQKQVLYEINHLASEFFHYLLTSHSVGKRALDYALGRGISKESIEQFKLGYSPNMWEGLQDYLVKKKGYRVEDLEKAGLIISSSRGRSRYYDRFRARLMFPLKDHRDNIRGFSGRLLDPNVKEAKYVNTPETLVYHKSDLLYGLSEAKEAIKKADQAIIVEGELDMISSYQAGVKNVVAIKGSALTSNQAELLTRFSKNIVLALDADAAGDQAAHRGIETADRAGMNIRVVEIEGGKDPDEVAQKNPGLWKKLVKKAVSIYDYFLDSAFSRFNSRTAEGKRKIGQELTPILAKISDEIVQSHYVNLLAERLEVDQQAVVAQIDKSKPGIKTQLTVKTRTAEEKTRQEILEEHLLALALQAKKWRLLRKKSVVVLIKTPRLARIIEAIGHYLKKYKTMKSARLAKSLAPELVDAFNHLYLLNLGDLLEDEEKFEREFEKTALGLEKLSCRKELKQLETEIRLVEKEPKPDKETKKKLQSLNNQFRDLSVGLTEIEKK